MQDRLSVIRQIGGYPS